MHAAITTACRSRECYDFTLWFGCGSDQRHGRTCFTGRDARTRDHRGGHRTAHVEREQHRLWIQELLKNWIEVKAYSDVLVVINSYLLAAVGTFTNKSPLRDGWMVQQVDNISLERLTPEFPLQIATIVANALLGWIEKENPTPSRAEKSQGTDMNGLAEEDLASSYWLEDFRIQPSYREFEGTLARRLFLASEQVYHQGEITKIELLDQLLRSRSWALFERIRWQLYADFPSISFEHARKDVLSRIPFLNRIEMIHNYEFAQLLISHSKQYGGAFLAPDEVEQFASSVMKGPIDKDGKLFEWKKDFFYKKQLWPIASLLRGKQLAAYRVLVPDDDAKQNRRDFGSRLGTHIACYYWSGSFVSDSEGDAALDRFFDVASRST